MTVLRIEDDPRGFRTALIDRPERRNAIDDAVVSGLRVALEEMTGDVLVLGSTDRRAFSSGADLDLADPDRASVSDSLYGLYGAMRESPAIIIAAASGYAVGAGAQLLIASDVRIAAPDLRVRFVGPGHGLVVGAWGLPGLIGRGRAMDLCLSMREVTAEEAATMGLIDEIADDPLYTACEYAATVTELNSRAVRDLKRIIAVPDSRQALAAERRRNAEWDGYVPR